MKACVIEKPLHYVIEDLPIPEIKDDEVLLRVTTAGICTNDVRDYKGSNYTYPRIGGHEYAGVIEKIGRSVDPELFHVGQKVVNYIIEECGVCYSCKHHAENLCDSAASGKVFYNKDGISGYMGYAEYVSVKARHLYIYNDSVSDEEIAFTEPLACVINSINKTKPQMGDDVVVIGGGVMGLLHVLCCKQQGTYVIVSETDPKRRDFALKLGADAVIDPMKEDAVKQVKELTGGRGAQIVYNTTAIPAVAEQAVEMAAKSGTVNMFSSMHPNDPIKVDAGRIHSQEIKVTGTVSPTTLSFAQAVDCIQKKIIDVRPLIDKTFEYQDITAAMEYAARPDTYKVMIHFSDAKEGE
jgi:threonine dehydrogenase-like Zn-dependent dehydrogenase